MSRSPSKIGWGNGDIGQVSGYISGGHVEGPAQGDAEVGDVATHTGARLPYVESGRECRAGAWFVIDVIVNPVAYSPEPEARLAPPSQTTPTLRHEVRRASRTDSAAGIRRPRRAALRWCPGSPPCPCRRSSPAPPRWRRSSAPTAPAARRGDHTHCRRRRCRSRRSPYHYKKKQRFAARRFSGAALAT